MAFDFPNSPSNGQVFTPVGGPSYTWNGTVWTATVNPGGQLTADSYNRIVNGAMQHSQENGNTASAAAASNAAYYAADQWLASWSVATGTAYAARVTQPTGGSPGYIGLATTPGCTLAAGSYASFSQRIEGNRIADLEWGTANAKQAVLRLRAWHTTGGTFTVRIGNADLTRSWLAPITLTAGITETILVIPGDTTGTWLKDTGIGVVLEFNIASGSNGVGVAGWQAGNKYSLAGATNGLAAGNTGVNLTSVGLYLDPNNTGVPPPWVTPDYAAELAACQRYWYRAGNDSAGVASGLGYRYGPASATLYDAGLIPFPVPMRAAPTVTLSTPTYTNCSALSAYVPIDLINAAMRVTVTALGGYRVTNYNATFNARM
jgi:hypothetical protein